MEYRFSDLFEWTSGKPIAPTVGDIPVYGSNGIIGFTDKPKYKNKIILGRVGAYCGSVAYCQNDFNATDNTLITTCNEKLIIYKYAFYLLKQYHLNDFAGGAAQPLITQGLLKHLKCNIPPIETQHRISDILSTYDNLIEANNKRIKILEQMAENLYKEWFVRFRFLGHETAEFENGIPKGWLIKRADEVIEFNPTIKAEYQKKYRIIPMEALSTYSMLLDESKFEFENAIKGRHSQNGDTLLAKITPCLENGKTGFVSCLSENEVAGGSTEFVVMRSVALSPYYVYLFARSQYFRQIAILSMNGADGRQRVDEEKLKAIKIPVPTKDVITQFNLLVKSLFDEVSMLSKKNLNLVKQRDLLLPRLMSGKLEV